MNNFLKFHMEDKKEDMKKKWKILEYLDNDNVEVMNARIGSDEKKYSISRLKQIFRAR